MRQESLGSKNLIRVGLVGAGGVSVHHARAVKRWGRAMIVGVADPCLERARRLVGEFRLPAAYASLAEMAAADPQVIHVLTPPEFHCSVTLEALRMGCHVFVEKPMAQTPEECRRMIAAANAAGRVLSVNHSSRMDPIVRRALDLVNAGACGEILGLDYLRGSDYPAYAGGPIPYPFRDGAYPFQDLGVHGLSLFEAFLGDIEKLDARWSSSGRNPNLYFDEWRILAQCRKGTGHLYLSWGSRPIHNEIVIHGTRGTIQVDCFLQTCVVRRTFPAPKFLQLAAGVVGNACSVLGQTGWNCLRFAGGRFLPSPGIYASIAAFYNALARAEAPPIDAEQGRRLVAWMEEPRREANAEKERRFQFRPAGSQPRILVTGASGMLGGALLRRLIAEGKPVRVLLRRPAAALERNPLIECVWGDLGDPDAVDRAVSGMELVYHLGAAMRGGAAEFEAGTVWGAKNMVAACLRHGVGRLVYVSSLTVLDHAGHRPGEIITETAPLEPHAEKRGFYTQSKLLAEQIIAAAARDRNLPAVILRPGQIFGPGAEKVAPSGTIAVAGRWVVVGSGDLPLPLVDVEDVVDALLLAANAEKAHGAIYHLVDSERITQNEYLALCQRASGGKLHVTRAPRVLLYGAALMVEALCALLRRKPPLSRYRLRSARPLNPCVSAAPENELGWVPRVGIREGLKRVFEPPRRQDEPQTEAQRAGL